MTANSSRSLSSTGGFVVAVRVLLGDEIGGNVARREPRVAQQAAQEIQIGGHAADVVTVERIHQPRRGLGAILAVGDQLGDHGVVVHRNLAALVGARIDANARAGRFLIIGEAADRGQKAAPRVLGIHARLDGPAGQRHVFLAQRQGLAGGDADHLLDQIDAGHQLGHRMLHLQAGVHLQEVEIALLVDDELHRAGRVITDGARQRHRLLAHGAAHLGRQEQARRLLDHLLVAALDGALALAQVHDVALPVAEHLDFDVPRAGDVFLDEHPVVAEAGTRLGGRGAKALGHFLAPVHHPHALAAAAGGGLDHDREADVLGDAHRLVGCVDDADVAGHGADAGCDGQFLGLDLVAHGAHGALRRADEHHARLFQPAGELGVLGQEAVARVHGLRHRWRR